MLKRVENHLEEVQKDIEKSEVWQVLKLLLGEIKKKADEVESHLEDACGDLGFEHSQSGDMHFGNRGWDEKVKQAKKDGVQDISGWLADEMYNDVDSLCDMSGDRIHDEASNYRIRTLIQILIALEIKEDRYSHKSLVKAMDSHIKGWKEHLKI